MKKIGLISDTHGFIDKKILDFFSDCNQIWHAGDIGNISVIEKLSEIAEIKAVFGNIDDYSVRIKFKEHNKFLCEQLNIWITHIGGYPGHYDSKIKNLLTQNPPDIFVTGHSHILKIIYDKKYNLLHLNPGAYGISGFHKVRTALKFEAENKDIRNMQILEINR